MEALIVGCGSIGERHLRNILDMECVSDVSVCDVDREKLQTVEKRYGVWTTVDLEEAFGQKPDITLICTPPHTHLNIAESAIQHSPGVFIEKPLSNSLDGVDEFVNRVEADNRTIMLGCNMRFHPPVRKISNWLEEDRIGRIEYCRLRYGNLLSNWRSGDYTDHYSAKDEEGGGIILDAIHEIDLALEWLSRCESIQCTAGKYSDLDINVEDASELILEGSNQLGSVHLDYIRPQRVRKYELIGTEGMIEWTARGKDPEISELHICDENMENREQFDYELTLNEMYVDEIKHFIDSVRNGESPVVGVSKGRDALETAIRAKRAAGAGERWALNPGSYVEQ